METPVGKQISQLERVFIETTDHSDPFGLSRGVSGQYGDNREKANFLVRNIWHKKKKYFTFRNFLRK